MQLGRLIVKDQSGGKGSRDFDLLYVKSNGKLEYLMRGTNQRHSSMCSLADCLPYGLDARLKDGSETIMLRKNVNPSQEEQAKKIVIEQLKNVLLELITSPDANDEKVRLYKMQLNLAMVGVAYQDGGENDGNQMEKLVNDLFVQHCAYEEPEDDAIQIGKLLAGYLAKNPQIKPEDLFKELETQVVSYDKKGIFLKMYYNSKHLQGLYSEYLKLDFAGFLNF